MLTSIQGIYRDGQIELNELPSSIENNTPVIVTFFGVKNTPISLAKLGIGEQQAHALRLALSSFSDEWDSPEMIRYDSYHKEVREVK